MKWENLLSLKRQGDSLKRLRSEQDNTRVGFDVDYDRIVFSSFFRSLQDKTQVVPFSKTSFVHTRLTHSLEVSVVGRSLGRVVGKFILDKYPYLKEVYKFQINDFGSIVAAACLSHDIGNPPFGHSGESAIGDFFKIGDGVKYKSQLTDLQYNDLCTFEGNANGLKILTENREGIYGGLRLSYATLGAFIKYPKESLPKKPTNHIADKKYGCFQSEKEAFLDIVEDLGLLKKSKTQAISYHRHPLTFLVEAADDICYTIIDFEDGINLGLIEEEFALEYLIKLVKNTIDTKKYHALKFKKDRVSYLRALAINTLINEAVDIFLANETAILEGAFSTSLLDKCAYEAQINDILKISISKIYKSQEVVEKEVAGYKIIADLLDIFVTALNNHYKGAPTNYDSLLLNLLPKEFMISSESSYERIMAICTYVSRMSDSYAIRIHKKIQGSIM